ncbi:MAG: SRPBCC domain-containing protein [Chitinophagaceae bacterium]
MDTQTKARFTKDKANKKITVIKDFDADIDTVWKAFTDSKQLDKWWAPKPYKAETKEMNFKEGGRWLYAMVGPDGERHWAIENFETIDKPNQIVFSDAFTDENGKTDTKMPTIRWTNSFNKTEDGTQVTAELKFDSEEDMKKILDTGFEEGFQMGLSNLDELLAK